VSRLPGRERLIPVYCWLHRQRGVHVRIGWATDDRERYRNCEPCNAELAERVRATGAVRSAGVVVLNMEGE